MKKPNSKLTKHDVLTFKNLLRKLIKVTIITAKEAKNKVDSFWYGDTEQIATIELFGRTISAEPRGEIKIFFDNDGCYYRNEMAIKEARSKGFTDKDLNNLEAKGGGWDMNNWLVCIEIDKDGNSVSDDLDICYDYDECIEIAKDILIEDFCEKNNI